MKKLTKKIMALMLSLVMVLGCIPSFINEASADSLPKIEVTLANLSNTKTVSDVQIYNLNFINKASKKYFFQYTYTAYPTYTTVAIYDKSDLSTQLEGTSELTDSTEYHVNVYCTSPISYQNTSTFTSLKNFNDFDATTIVNVNGVSDWTIKNTTCSNDSNTVTFAFDLCFLTPIDRVDITSSGVLATNIQTVKYEVADDANYALDDDPSTGWYKDGNFTEPHDFATSAVPAYKKLKIVPKTGYKFDTIPEVYVDEFPISNNISINADGDLLVDREKYVVQGYVSLNFEKPTTYSDYLALKGDRSKFTMDGKDLDTEGGFDAIEATQITSNANDKGYYYLVFTYTFDTEQELDKVPNFHFRGTHPVIQDGISPDTLLNMNVGDVYVYKVKGDKYQIIVYEKYDFRKTATITFPVEPGTTVKQIKDNISMTTTETTTTAVLDAAGIVITDLGSSTELSEDTDVLENGKEYLIEIRITDTEHLAYSTIKVNNTVLDYRIFTDPDVKNNHYMYPFALNKIAVYYKVKAQQPGGSSKTYKATDNKDTVEKISGTGKKGSKRTITPAFGKKVERVTVTDKDGNKIDVTKNADGTYSFIQPASNVNVEVTYKNREIVLNIGSTEASVDGVMENLDVCPLIRNDRTMLPIRFVAENLGAKVEWDEKSPEYVLITKGNIKIEITLGSDIAKVNGKEYKLDSASFAENDRTYLPVRFVSENLNAIVEWNEEKPMEVKIYER